MMKKYIFLFIGLFCSQISANSQTSESAQINQKSVEMNTYPFSDPNPIADPSKSIYPYFRFDGYTSQAEKKEWKVVELENNYIKLRITPEIGGKIWGALEKKSNENFIYDNDVVKFRDIAMRGAWVSGGVEINFGLIGHAPWTATPVDYIIKENSDGSVSCFVGTLDLLTRAWWSCEIKLEKDKAYFTTTTKWYNPSLVSAPYYNWMNAGYNQTEDMEYYFPGSHSISHGGDADKWSIDDKGRDLSKYSENGFGSAKSYHIVGKVADYYATYWHEKEYGSGHHSAFDEKLGMKIFLWGLSREGMIWEGLLTDNSGQYVELQSGRLFNQEAGTSMSTPFKHFKHAAASSEDFTEYWYPIKDTKGVLSSNKYATINISNENGNNTFHISPLQNINHLVTIKCAEKVVYSKHLKLEPMESFSDIINSDLNGDITVTLGDNLLVYSQQYIEPTSRPMEITKDFDESSLYGRYVMGCQSMYVNQFDEAKRLLESVLAEDSNFAPALNALASIDFKQARYAKAKKRALLALSIDTYDADANILYGLTSSYLNQGNDAIDGYSVAALSSSHRTAAYIGLAKEYAKRNAWQRVVEYAHKIQTTSYLNSDALQLLAVAYRNLGDKTEALEAIEKLSNSQPLNHFARFEKVLLQNVDAKELTANVLSELKYELYLEMGLWYESIGRLDDALKLYSLAGEHPQILYRTAYVQNLIGVDFKATLNKASNSSVAFMLPSRHESLQLFEWAVQNNNQWQNKYYLALISWHLSDKDKALKLMDELGDTPDFAPFYITRSILKTGQPRLDDLLKAESLEQNWRIGSLLIKEYKVQNNSDKMLETAQIYRDLYGNDFRLGMAYVPVLMDNGKYEQAVKYLEDVEIIPYEGAIEGRTMYRDCNLHIALKAIKAKRYKKALAAIDKSTIWIENLGVGQPFLEDIDSRTEDYMRAYCYQKMGNKSKAEELYRSVASSSSLYNSNTILSALALRKQGDQQQAQELLTKYMSYNNNEFVAQWAKEFYEGDFSLAEQTINNNDTKSRVGTFGANDFKDFGYITIVKEVVKL